MGEVHSNFTFALSFTLPVKLTGSAADAFSAALVDESGESEGAFTWEVIQNEEYSN